MSTSLWQHRLVTTAERFMEARAQDAGLVHLTNQNEALSRVASPLCSQKTAAAKQLDLGK